MTLVSGFLNDSKFLTFLKKPFDEFFHILVFTRTFFIVCSHYFPFANLDQIPELAPKAERSTPESFGSTPSRAFDPCGELGA